VKDLHSPRKGLKGYISCRREYYQENPRVCRELFKKGEGGGGGGGGVNVR